MNKEQIPVMDFQIQGEGDQTVITKSIKFIDKDKFIPFVPPKNDPEWDEINEEFVEREVERIKKNRE